MFLILSMIRRVTGLLLHLDIDTFREQMEVNVTGQLIVVDGGNTLQEMKGA